MQVKYPSQDDMCMGTRQIRLVAVLCVAALLSCISPASGQTDSATAAAYDPADIAGEPSTEKCVICHQAVQPLGLPKANVPLSESVHGDMDCTDCHTGVEELTLPESLPTNKPPHPARLQPVDCGECHDEAAEIYTMHGRAKLGEDEDIPTCAECHGAHDILSISDRRSHVHPINLPDTCSRCHEDLDLAKKHEILVVEPIKMYKSSVHGQATQKGLYVAATCDDCHSAAGPNGQKTAHRILGPGHPESPIYHFNIPNTCGRCHERPAKDYWEGIHGKFVARGEVDSPVCTRCHGEHGILKTDDPRSPVSKAKLAEHTCSPCHDSAVLNEKYGLPAGRLQSFVDSYHGLKTKAGDTRVANCASCHGDHRILPSTDSTSSIHPDQLQETCGDCHPGISAELAQTKIHETGAGIKTGWPHFFTVFYIVLIAVTIGLMLLHNIAHWWRHVKHMVRQPYIIRLNTNEVIQHWLLAISFIVLVITGFALRFSESWWVRLLFGWEHGFDYRGIIHRCAGVMMIFATVWHVVYLFGKRGRHWMRDMLASKNDARDVWHSCLYFLGIRPEPPRFGRFTYMEKCEYWALAWGAVIMAVTGLLLWFDNIAIKYLAKGVLDVMLVIHYYEAWLASLAILVWHIYGTVFSPGCYPMNPAWWSGRMPKLMYEHEHPDGPRLKARVFVPHAEEELDAEEDDSSSATPPHAGGTPD